MFRQLINLIYIVNFVLVELCTLKNVYGISLLYLYKNISY